MIKDKIQMSENVKVENAARKKLVGLVLKAKMQKTLVVEVTRLVRHSLYGKTIMRKRRIKVHDEKGEAKAGDRVCIQETRPLSKDKRYRLVSIISKGVDISHDL
jgi:small subunit ribosomal protein S17